MVCCCWLLVGSCGLLGIWYGAKGYCEENYLLILWCVGNIACLFFGNRFYVVFYCDRGVLYK